MIGHLLFRALNSLNKVCVDQKDLDLLLKFITFLNLIRKVVHKSSSPLKLFVWPFRDCTVTCYFHELRYTYWLSKNCDFNIYMNPYFHEYDVFQFVYHILTTGDVFLDVGSHSGLYTLLAAKKVGSQGMVLSFEPNPLNLIFLRRNIILNKLNNVIIIPKALSDKAGKVTLYYPSKRTALTSSFIKAKNFIEVEATTIDDAIVSLLDRDLLIKCIKIDT